MDIRPMLRGYKLGQMLRVRSGNDGRTVQTESLGCEQNIDIESRGIGCWSAGSPRLSPQLRSEAEGFIGQWNVPVWGGVHECLQTGNSNELIGSQQFAL